VNDALVAIERDDPRLKGALNWNYEVDPKNWAL
jgi:hypothetical protein